MQTPATLMPAAQALPHHRPTLPPWFPVPTGRVSKDGTELPDLTPDEQRRERLRAEVREAVTGPYDGRRVRVRYAQRPPAEYHPAPGWVYVLDEALSTPHHLRYRYSPDSPQHQLAMRAVEQAYAEVGPEYTIAARQETASAPHPAP